MTEELLHHLNYLHTMHHDVCGLGVAMEIDHGVLYLAKSNQAQQLAAYRHRPLGACRVGRTWGEVDFAPMASSNQSVKVWQDRDIKFDAFERY